MALPVRRNTEMTRWDPFAEVDDMQSRFAELMESTFGEAARMMSRWTPAVDIEETDTAYVLEAELPGVKEDDVTIELQGNELHISGEVRERERVGVLRRRTRRTGHFDYRVHLPRDVDADAVTATLDEGVLRVEVGKSETARPRRIEITRG